MSVRFSPKDFFLQLAVFVSMYVSVVTLLILLFEYINIFFPDEFIRYTGSYSGAMRFSIASLIVVFPIFIFLTRILNQDFRKNPEKRESGIHRWLIFLTLFVAGLTLVIDFIALINIFLNGDITARFVFKSATVLIVIGGAFAYYFYDIKGKWWKNEKLSKNIGWVISSIVLVSVFSGFFIIGSPQSQRLLRFDQAKINDLSNIQWQIVQYWQQKKKLPQNLSNLNDSILGFRIPRDKQNDEEYSYKTLEILTFELCATFNLESKKEWDPQRSEPSSIYFGSKQNNWQHKKGYQCFERKIDPDLYPSLPKQ